MSSRATAALLALILLVALGLRLGWCLTRPVRDDAIDQLPDQREYLELSRNLARGDGLQFLDKRFGETVWAFRMPGYPLFLAACRGDVRIARTAQAAIDTSTVLAVFILATLLAPGASGKTIGLVAGGICAVHPYLIYFNALILSETLFTAILAWGLVLLVRGARAESWRGGALWYLSIALLAASVLVRPSAIGLPVVLGLASLFVNRVDALSYQRTGAGPSRCAAPPGLIAVVFTLLALLPWALRNQQVTGSLIWLDTNSGFTLYDAYNPDATGSSDQSFVAREPQLQLLNESQRSDYLSYKAIEYARSHPGRVVNLAGARLARIWSPMPLSSQFGKPLYRVIGLTFSIPLDLLVLMGLFRGNIRRWAKVLLLAPAIYLTVVHALTIGSLRYRIPAEPLLALLAAAGILVLGAQQRAGEP